MLLLNSSPLSVENKNFGLQTETKLIFFFFPWLAARGILVSPPGIKPVLPAVESQSLNPWIARDAPKLIFN